MYIYIYIYMCIYIYICVSFRFLAPAQALANAGRAKIPNMAIHDYYYCCVHCRLQHELPPAEDRWQQGWQVLRRFAHALYPEKVVLNTLGVLA